MTNGRRSSAVPQLKCVGGTAGYSAPQPKVVQCINRGSDGYDVQWECKADMDYDYRFGKVQVSCEGYDNPNDPYVLRGSCGVSVTNTPVLSVYPLSNFEWLLVALRLADIVSRLQILLSNMCLS